MLADQVRRIRSARDLGPLLAALSYVPEVDATGGHGLCLARWRGFEVVGCDAERPRDQVRALAGTLASHSRRALAVAVGQGEVAFAAPRLGLGGSTRVLAVSIAHPDSRSLELLSRLSPAGAAHALAHALRVAELLSTENMGERFYRAFRDVFGRMAATLRPRGPEADCRTAALLALTRVLFLYFVQAKGWLDGRPDYLRRLLDHSLSHRRPFHRTALHPLFFGTLNRPPGERRIAAQLGHVPYLNGGLFEPHPVERRLGPALFPNDLWRDAFDGLFERFRFCVRESHELDAIAPDMLGHVFERLMDPDDRHATGTYYTPESVVRQMVGLALNTALGTASGPPSLAALRAVRVLDPAVGSGAFLLGALERLTELRLGLGEGPDRSAVRRAVLRESLFGVDLSPVAVRLAELRLWLAIVADDPTTDIARVAPLPNLDGVVRQGDALLDPLGAARAMQPGLPLGPRAANAVHQARRALFEARGPGRRRGTRDLLAVERRLAQALLAAALHLTRHRAGELAALDKTPDLFGRAAGLGPDRRAELRRLRGQETELRRAATDAADGRVPFFSFEVQAPDVLAAGGFTVVLGNPPWVRAERLAPARRRILKERFAWWRAGGGPGYAHQPDLAIAFVQRALELAAPGGAVALLLPSKIATARYAETARRGLVRETQIHYVHRVPEREARRFGATTYPLALVLTKGAPAPGSSVALGPTGDARVLQRALDRPGPWVLVPDAEREALDRFRSTGRPLAQLAPPALGVKTGADALFLGPVLSRRGDRVLMRLDGEEVEVEAPLVRPALRGRDLRPFAARSSAAIIWPYLPWGEPLRLLPPLGEAYFRPRRARLERRADYHGGPIWSVYRVRPALAPHPVVWPDIARRPIAFALTGPADTRPIPLNTCYIAPAPDPDTALAIAAVFNSTWTAALLRVTADEARGGYRRINASVAGQVPIPASRSAVGLLATVAARAQETGHCDQAQLDDAVGRALDLPQRTRGILRRLAGNRR